MDNTLVWADIPTRDLDRAMDFYSALLDVQVTPIQEETMRFAMLRHDGSNAAAVVVFPVPPFPLRISNFFKGSPPLPRALAMFLTTPDCFHPAHRRSARWR